MRDAAWIKLLRHIPASEQSKLTLVTAGGIEIAIQSLLRIDPECLALRGRLAGSTDAGRVFFVPYSHIDYFGFQQPLKETEFHELFGSLEDLATEAPPEPPPAPPPAAPVLAPPPPPPPPPRVPSDLTPPRGPSVIKSTVLEKFRARSTTTNPGTQMRPGTEE